MSNEKANSQAGKDDDEEALEPLKISCQTTDCASGLHYFKQTKQMREGNVLPKCDNCKADLVKWEEVWERDLNDVENTFKSLKYEFIRHHYWHKEFDEKANNYALRKGKIELLKTVEKRIRSSVKAPADAFDGRRTKCCAPFVETVDCTRKSSRTVFFKRNTRGK